METRERILKKAIELYFRYGIRSITMDEIATHCGMSKKTIYQFFEDKDALVDAVIDAEIDSSQGECMSTKQNSENAIHEVFLAVKDVIELFDSMHASVLFDLRKHHPQTYNKLEQHKSEFLFAVLKDNIIRGQQEGTYRTDINADIIAFMRLQTVFATITQEHELFSKKHYTPSQVLEEITDHYLHGLATVKGVKMIEEYKQEIIKKEHL